MSTRAFHHGLVSFCETGSLELLTLTVQYITKYKALGSTEDR